jgi:glycosyltransferase involved in cell wall biosynthesis/nucleotide-binding universal stress UspA family protein
MGLDLQAADRSFNTGGWKMKPPIRKIKTVLIPVGVGKDEPAALTLARKLAEEIILVGVVPIGEHESVSAGAQKARQVRRRLLSLSGPRVHFKSTVVVSQEPWTDLLAIITREKPELLMTGWDHGLSSCGIPIADMFSSPTCNIAVVRGESTAQFERALVAVRGGPHAELAFQMGLELHPAQLDVLHLSLEGATNDAPFKGIKHILRHIPEANLRTVTTEDIARTIFEEAQAYDLVILGATAGKSLGSSSIGPVAEKLLQDSSATVMVVKTHVPVSEAAFDERVGVQAISILVDKWFAENTYHADEFSDLGRLMNLKQQQGMTISLALPALNEEQTVGKVISTVKKALMDDVPLLDEIVLVDSDSTDQTRKIAEDLGVPVYIHQHILPELGARNGKGEALWKSLLVTRGDILAWIDTDIVNIHPRFVYGIIGPLLLDKNIQFVKGFYRRPLRVNGKVQAGGGGRVTELTARPLINLFYPELSGVIQPLSGEYAGRRASLEKAIFFSGYGVETGLLIDMFENYGLRAIAQVDLLERIHHNQELEALGKMSFTIIQAVLRKLESRYERAIIEDVNKTMKLIRRNDNGYFLDVEEVAELERPPMNSIPEYLERQKN